MEPNNNNNNNNNDSRTYGNMIWRRRTTLSELAAQGGRNQLFTDKQTALTINKINNNNKNINNNKKHNGSLEFLFSLFLCQFDILWRIVTDFFE